MKLFKILILFILFTNDVLSQKPQSINNVIYVYKFSPLDIFNLIKPSIVIGVEKWNVEKRKSNYFEFGYILPHSLLTGNNTNKNNFYQGVLLRYQKRWYKNNIFQSKNIYNGFETTIGDRVNDRYENNKQNSFSDNNVYLFYSQYRQNDLFANGCFILGEQLLNTKNNLKYDLGIGFGMQYFYTTKNGLYSPNMVIISNTNPISLGGLCAYFPLKLKIGFIK